MYQTKLSKSEIRKLVNVCVCSNKIMLLGVHLLVSFQKSCSSIHKMLWNGKIKCLFRGTNITAWHMCWGSCHCVTVKIETREGFAETSAGSDYEHYTTSTRTWTRWCSGGYLERQISILGLFHELFRVGPLQISGGSVWEGLTTCAQNLTLGWKEKR